MYFNKYTEKKGIIIYIILIPPNYLKIHCFWTKEFRCWASWFRSQVCWFLTVSKVISRTTGLENAGNWCNEILLCFCKWLLIDFQRVPVDINPFLVISQCTLLSHQCLQVPPHCHHVVHNVVSIHHLPLPVTWGLCRTWQETHRYS